MPSEMGPSDTDVADTGLKIPSKPIMVLTRYRCNEEPVIVSSQGFNSTQVHASLFMYIVSPVFLSLF